MTYPLGPWEESDVDALNVERASTAPTRAPVGEPLLTPLPVGPGIVRPRAGLARALLGGTWFALAAYALWRLGLERAGDERGLVADLAFFPFYPAAGAASAIAARASAGRVRAGLWALAGAWFASCAGESLYLAARAFPAARPFLEATGDGLDATYYPLAALGFLALAARPRGLAPRLRLAADALVAAAAATALVWYFVLRHLGPVSTWRWHLEKVMGSGAGEVLILFAAGLALARPAREIAGPPLHALAAGVLALALGDLSSAQHAFTSDAGTSLAGDLLLTAGTALSTTGGLLVVWPGGPAAVPRWLAAALQPLGRLPALAVAAVLGLLTIELARAPSGAVAGLASAAAGLALVVMARLRLAERALEAEAAARVEQEQRLQQAQRLELLGLLTGAVAHDFANLLAGLGGTAQALAERLPEGIPEVEEVREVVRRGRALCQQLLATGRRAPAPTAAVDPRDVVDGVLPLLRRLVPRTVALETSGEPGRVSVGVDRTQLELALMNLVVNARDAMPTGGVVWIRAERLDVPPGSPWNRRGVAAGRHARLVVADTGVGMDAETLRHATEPFFTTKPAGRGTGLGLASVQALADAAGGRLLVDSTPGRGTVVTLVLPAT